MAEPSLANIGFTLIILGFVIAVVAVVLLALRGRGAPGQTRGGGILLIGPIPIIFGSDKESVRVLVALAIIMIAIFLIFMIIPTLLLTR